MLKSYHISLSFSISEFFIITYKATINFLVLMLLFLWLIEGFLHYSFTSISWCNKIPQFQSCSRITKTHRHNILHWIENPVHYQNIFILPIRILCDNPNPASWTTSIILTLISQIKIIIRISGHSPRNKSEIYKFSKLNPMNNKWARKLNKVQNILFYFLNGNKVQNITN